MEYPIYHLCFLGIEIYLNTIVKNKKIQAIREIFHEILSFKFKSQFSAAFGSKKLHKSNFWWKQDKRKGHALIRTSRNRTMVDLLRQLYLRFVVVW